MIATDLAATTSQGTSVVSMQKSVNQRITGGIPTWAWIIYLLLLAIGVPWYWQWPAFQLSENASVWGLPVWVAVAIGASAATSVLTAALLIKPWPGEDEAADIEATRTLSESKGEEDRAI